MIKKYKNTIVFLLLFLLITINILPLNTGAVDSKYQKTPFSGYSGDFLNSNQELYNETNTFNYLAAPASNGAKGATGDKGHGS